MNDFMDFSEPLPTRGREMWTPAWVGSAKRPGVVVVVVGIAHGPPLELAAVIPTGVGGDQLYPHGAHAAAGGVRQHARRFGVRSQQVTGRPPPETPRGVICRISLLDDEGHTRAASDAFQDLAGVKPRV